MRGIRRLRGEKYIDRAIMRAHRSFDIDRRQFEETRTRFLKTDRSVMSLFDVILRLRAEREGKRRFGEKTPRHFLHLRAMLRFYPGARIVYMCRDPRNAHSSFRKSPLVKRMNAVDKSSICRSFYWNSSMRILQRYSNSAHRAQFLKVRFEDLIEEPEDSIRSLCAFLGEPYQPGMLRVDKVNSSFGKYKDGGIIRDTLARMRHLGGTEMFFIELFCGKYMLEEGYVPRLLSSSLIRFLRIIGFYALTDLLYRFASLTRWKIIEYATLVRNSTRV